MRVRLKRLKPGYQRYQAHGLIFGDDDTAEVDIEETGWLYRHVSTNPLVEVLESGPQRPPAPAAPAPETSDRGLGGGVPSDEIPATKPRRRRRKKKVSTSDG